MANLIGFAAGLLLVLTIAFVNCSEESISFNDEVIVTQNFKLSPRFKLLHRLNERALAEDSPTIIHKEYKFGERVTGSIDVAIKH